MTAIPDIGALPTSWFSDITGMSRGMSVRVQAYVHMQAMSCQNALTWYYANTSMAGICTLVAFWKVSFDPK